MVIAHKMAFNLCLNVATEGACFISQSSGLHNLDPRKDIPFCLLLVFLIGDKKISSRISQLPDSSSGIFDVYFRKLLWTKIIQRFVHGRGSFSFNNITSSWPF